MSDKKTDNLRRAYELFRQARGSLDLEELNRRLSAEGLKGVSPRMLIHLRKLNENDIPEYVPANHHERWRSARRAGANAPDPIPAAIQATLREQNPWWSNLPGPAIPSFRRWLFPKVQRSLLAGLTPAVALRDPRHARRPGRHARSAHRRLAAVVASVDAVESRLAQALTGSCSRTGR